jgi:hypothetical protein
MNLSDKISIPEQVMARKVGDETVILDLVSGTYYGLDPLGSRIWQLLGGGLSLSAVCEKLLEEYDVSADVLQGDVLRLVGELRTKSLVLTPDEPK